MFLGQPTKFQKFGLNKANLATLWTTVLDLFSHLKILGIFVLTAHIGFIWYVQIDWWKPLLPAFRLFTCGVPISRQAYILIIIINDHYFFPLLAGLFTFILDTSQIIVKFYRQTSWPQPFTSRVMQHELNLELDNSRDKPDKNQILLSFKGALYSKHNKLG